MVRTCVLQRQVRTMAYHLIRTCALEVQVRTRWASDKTAVSPSSFLLGEDGFLTPFYSSFCILFSAGAFCFLLGISECLRRRLLNLVVRLGTLLCPS